MVNGSRLHWWILLGILAGVALGAGINRAHVGPAQEAVLGESYTREDLRARAARVNEELERRVNATPLGAALEGVSRIFLNLLKMIVVPLVFFSLVSGLATMGDVRRLGRIGVKTLAWYAGTSLLAVLTGLVLVHLIGPGRGVEIRIPVAEIPSYELPGSFWDLLVRMVPDNVVRSAAEFDMFGVIFFSVLFGIFLLTVEAKARQALTVIIDGGLQVMMAMTHFVIALAPVGVLAMVAHTTATSGLGIFASLGGYVLTVLLGLGLHLLVTIPLLLWLLTRRNPYRYLRGMSPALLTGFSAASSSGALAVTMERATEGAGISERIASFVLPLGSTVNMDGTALYECVTVLFIAQIHAAVDPAFAPLTLGQQGLVVFLALMISVGAAAIPHAGLVMMVIILQAVGLPVEYTAVIWAVDRPLDMCRTMVNIWSDSSGAAFVAHTEKEISGSRLFAKA